MKLMWLAGRFAVSLAVLSRWLLDTSVLHHVARAPATAVNWDSAAILTGIGIAAAIDGTLAFTRRDLDGA